MSKHKPSDEPPPLPLAMSQDDVGRVERFLYDRYGSDLGDSEVGTRLLVEILDCLRRIDDKLGRLLERPHC
jgi:hypothetical protein